MDIKIIEVEYDAVEEIYTVTVPAFADYRESITVNGYEVQSGESFTTDVKPRIMLIDKNMGDSEEIPIRVFTKETRQNPHITPMRHLGEDISSRRGKYSRPKAIEEIARNYLNENGFREIKGGYGGLTGWSYRLTNSSYSNEVTVSIGRNFRKDWRVETIADDLKLLHDQYDEDFRNVRKIIDQYMANTKEAFSRQDAIFYLEETKRRVEKLLVYKRKGRDKTDLLFYISGIINDIKQLDDEILSRLQFNPDGEGE